MPRVPATRPPYPWRGPAHPTPRPWSTPRWLRPGARVSRSYPPAQDGSVEFVSRPLQHHSFFDPLDIFLHRLKAPARGGAHTPSQGLRPQDQPDARAGDSHSDQSVAPPPPPREPLVQAMNQHEQEEKHSDARQDGAHAEAGSRASGFG